MPWLKALVDFKYKHQNILGRKKLVWKGDIEFKCKFIYRKTQIDSQDVILWQKLPFGDRQPKKINLYLIKRFLITLAFVRGYNLQQNSHSTNNVKWKNHKAKRHLALDLIPYDTMHCYLKDLLREKDLIRFLTLLGYQNAETSEHIFFFFFLVVFNENHEVQKNCF